MSPCPIKDVRGSRTFLTNRSNFIDRRKYCEVISFRTSTTAQRRTSSARVLCRCESVPSRTTSCKLSGSTRTLMKKAARISEIEEEEGRRSHFVRRSVRCGRASFIRNGVHCQIARARNRSATLVLISLAEGNKNTTSLYYPKRGTTVNVIPLLGGPRSCSLLSMFD